MQVLHRLEFCGGLLFARTQRGFHLLLPGNFPGNLGGAYNVSFGISDRRYGQSNIEQASILALPNRLIVFDALAARMRSRILGSSSCRSGGIKIVMDLPTASSAV